MASSRVEKNCLRISISDQRNIIKEINTTTSTTTKVIRSSSDYYHLQHQQQHHGIVKDCSNGDLVAGFSWPPRSYTCSFCRRDFRSAQALGGHMNVHRRDRARLRCLSPPPRDFVVQNHLLNLNNLDPNPNPNPSYSPSPSRKFISFGPNKKLYPFVPPPSFPCPTLASSSSIETTGKGKKFGEDFSTKSSPLVHHHKKEFVRLELEIGLKHEDFDLDLELRLGSKQHLA